MAVLLLLSLLLEDLLLLKPTEMPMPGLLLVCCPPWPLVPWPPWVLSLP
ncbi:hypothetical protein HF682_09090 [Leeia sp. IMCC25680]|uniref:Uncharacterized protein n=1 Tax=Leeia aquatica TaxID=2725557 RepID=A0A847S094_9NEIS|nr:hypothetical protein [Leeia aquatica]